MEREEKVDVAALMDEVRRRVAERRAAGEYPPELDDERPFAELAFYDELAASANRVASSAVIPEITPKLRPRLPGETGLIGMADEDAEELTLADLGLVDKGLVLARRATRKVVGARIDNFINHVASFMLTAAESSKLAAERIIALERRVAELEATTAATAAAPAKAATTKPQAKESARKAPASQSTKAAPRKPVAKPQAKAAKKPSGEKA